MIAYTTVASDDGFIKLTGVLNLYSASSDYESISLSFKDVDGEELEYWGGLLDVDGSLQTKLENGEN